MSAMDPTLQGIFFLVAVVLFTLAGLLAARADAFWATLVSVGLAFFSFVFMWQAFAAS